MKHAECARHNDSETWGRSTTAISSTFRELTRSRTSHWDVVAGSGTDRGVSRSWHLPFAKGPACVCVARLIPSPHSSPWSLSVPLPAGSLRVGAAPSVPAILTVTARLDRRTSPRSRRRRGLVRRPVPSSRSRAVSEGRRGWAAVCGDTSQPQLHARRGGATTASDRCLFTTKSDPASDALTIVQLPRSNARHAS